MRLLLTTDTVGGVWDYTATLANALEREGHSILLAVIGKADEDRIARLTGEIAIESRDLKLEWRAEPGDDLVVGARWIEELARTWAADVVHLNQMVYPGLVSFEGPTLVTVHSDVWSWYADTFGRSPPPEWAEYRLQVADGLHAADVVVTPSRYQADRVARHYGRLPDAVIHNAAWSDVRAPVEKREARVLSAGRAWDDAKGFALLDRALALPDGDGIAAHLLGPTEGPDGQRFIARNVRCEGSVPSADVGRWMRSSTVFASPSLYEPFGLAPLEAALSGCALVLSDIGSFRELWDGCAEFFPPGSAEGLAAALRKSLDDLAGCHARATAARTRAQERYTVQRFVEAYLDLYRMMRLIRGGPPSRTPQPLRQSTHTLS